MSKLYLLSQSVNVNYDTYDSCVVCADSEEEAKLISPSDYPSMDWAEPNNVEVQYLGIADKSIKLNTVICDSFNAG